MAGTSPIPRDLCFHGVGLSPGAAMGPAFVYPGSSQPRLKLHRIAPQQIETEIDRVRRAHQRVLAEIERSSSQVARELSSDLAGIFDAHQLILNDPSIWSEFKIELEMSKVNAEHAVRRVYDRWQRRLRALEHRPSRQLADDLADLCARILRALVGATTHALEAIPAGCVLVARRLLPSDTLYLSRKSTAGVVVREGGPGSHAALLALQMGLPTVFSPSLDLDAIGMGDLVLVDGFSGRAVLDPSERSVEEVEQQRATHERRRHGYLARRHEPSVTADGVEVAVMANIGCLEDAEEAADNCADGIGLFRMEHIYMAHTEPPGEEELLAALTHALQPVLAQQVTVRLLDPGGDRSLPGLALATEQDPLLGLRGVRVLLDRPDLLRTQLRALLRLSTRHDVQILVPMVTLVEEMQCVRRQLEEIAVDLGINRVPPLGAMIETPAAALCTDDMAKVADFLSVGTNDLTQYTLVAARENPLVSRYFQDDHRAIYRLLALVSQHAGDLPLTVCGQLAGRAAQVPALLQLGITTLSVAPGLVPRIKQAVRESGSNAA